MDLKAVGQRIKSAREAKNFTQEELAALVNLSPTHVSVIERGLKVTKLDTFVAIANALDVSADTLLIDVVAHSVTGVTNELTEKIEKLPIKEQKKIIKRELSRLREEAEAGRKDEEWLRYQVEELAAAHLKEGEQTELEQELEVLSNADRISETLTALRNALDDEQIGVFTKNAT